MTGVTIALMGRILGIAFASGLSLYATVATLGLAARFAWIEPLPVPLHGLESSLVIVSAVALFVVEVVVDKIRHVDSVWDAIHTFVRPAGGALLALGVLAGEPAAVVGVGVTAAAATALAAHGTRAGLRLLLSTADRTGAAAAASVLADVTSVAIVVTAFRRPEIALVATVLAVLTVALVARPVWRASVLGLRAIAARLRGFFRRSRWYESSALPAALREQLEPPTLGQPPHRAARVAFRRLPAAGAYRNGWLVVTPDGTEFVYRSLFRARRVIVPRARSARVRRGLMTDRVDIDAGDGTTFVLFLLKDGPPAERAVAELTTVDS